MMRSGIYLCALLIAWMQRQEDYGCGFCGPGGYAPGC